MNENNQPNGNLLTEEDATELGAQCEVPDAEVLNAVADGDIANTSTPLLSGNQKINDFPVDALGQVFSAAAKRIHEVVQAPLPICAQSILFAITSIVQGLANIEIDGRKIPLTAFFITVADSGERKSGADREALRVHRDEIKTRYAAYKSEMNTYQQELKDGGEAFKPLDPRFLTQDITYEGLIRKLLDGSPSVGISIDEGGLIIGGHAMTQENRIKTVAGFSKLWDGDAIDRERKEGGSVSLYDRRVSMHMLVQPKIFAKFFHDNDSLNQGFFSRCLISQPETRQAAQYKQVDLSSDPKMQPFYLQVLSILSKKLKIKQELGQIQFSTLQLTKEAKTKWIQIHNQFEQERITSLAEIKDLAAKAPEHVLRLAGILTLGANPDAQEIDNTAIENANELVKYYLEERLRLATVCSEQDELTKAHSVLEKLRKKGMNVFDKMWLMKNAPAPLRKKKELDPIITTLLDCGKISEVPKIKNTWQLVGASA